MDGKIKTKKEKRSCAHMHTHSRTHAHLRASTHTRVRCCADATLRCRHATVQLTNEGMRSVPAPSFLLTRRLSLLSGLKGANCSPGSDRMETPGSRPHGARTGLADEPGTFPPPPLGYIGGALPQNFPQNSLWSVFSLSVLSTPYRGCDRAL